MCTESCVFKEIQQMESELGIGDLGIGFVQVYIELPMFRRNVDSFPFRRISGTPAWPFLAKVMPKFFVNFGVCYLYV